MGPGLFIMFMLGDTVSITSISSLVPSQPFSWAFDFLFFLHHHFPVAPREGMQTALPYVANIRAYHHIVRNISLLPIYLER
jgi:hypothetical protein